MNERIRELAKRAELPVIDGEWDYNDREILCQDDGEWRVATPAEIISILFACEKGREKFAELIVRECAEALDKNISPPSHPMNSIGWKLKQHFGVEE